MGEVSGLVAGELYHLAPEICDLLRCAPALPLGRKAVRRRARSLAGRPSTPCPPFRPTPLCREPKSKGGLKGGKDFFQNTQVIDIACELPFVTETAGAACTRHSLLPRFFEEQRSGKPRASHAARMPRYVWKWQRKRHTLAVMPREGGASSTPRLLGSTLPSLEYWIARSSRAKTSREWIYES